MGIHGVAMNSSNVLQNLLNWDYCIQEQRFDTRGEAGYLVKETSSSTDESIKSKVSNSEDCKVGSMLYRKYRMKLFVSLDFIFPHNNLFILPL